MREPLFGCHRKQIVYPLIQRRAVPGKPKQSRADRQAAGQGWRMRQSPGLGDIGDALGQRLVPKTETEKGIIGTWTLGNLLPRKSIQKTPTVSHARANAEPM